MFKRKGSNLWLLCLAAAGTMLSHAQAPVGSISGTVRDQSGGAMQSVTITVTNNDTALQRQVVSDAEGTFFIASLPAGAYTVKAAAAGFLIPVETAQVHVGQITTVVLVLEIGPAREAIRVQAEAPLIQRDSHTISGVITRERIEYLPLNGRSFLQLASLEPGVTVLANGIGQANRQLNLNVLGASSNQASIRITVDGDSIADTVTGVPSRTSRKRWCRSFSSPR